MTEAKTQHKSRKIEVVSENTGVVHRIRRARPYVRVATYDDTPAIRDTLLKALAQAETPLPMPDQPYCQQAMMDLIAQGLVFVAETDDNRIVGVIALNWARWPWCKPDNPNGVHLMNEHLWIEPAYRKGGAAMRLLELAKARADCQQVPLKICLGYENGDLELKDKFVKARGFGYIGGNFYRMPKPNPTE